VYARIGGPADRASSRRAIHAHWGTLDGLRDKRGRGHLDFAACDAGRGATHADRGHNAVALTRLCFDFASAPHALKRRVRPNAQQTVHATGPGRRLRQSTRG
jgi:hypothetical protein